MNRNGRNRQRMFLTQKFHFLYLESHFDVHPKYGLEVSAHFLRWFFKEMIRWTLLQHRLLRDGTDWRVKDDEECVSDGLKRDEVVDIVKHHFQEECRLSRHRFNPLTFETFFPLSWNTERRWHSDRHVSLEEFMGSSETVKKSYIKNKEESIMWCDGLDSCFTCREKVHGEGTRYQSVER